MINLKEIKKRRRGSDISALRDILIDDGWEYDSDDFFWSVYGFGVSVNGNVVFVGTGKDYDDAIWEGSINDFINGYMGVSGRPGKFGTIEIDHVEYNAYWR